MQSANVSIRQVDNTGGMEKDIIIFVATPSEARHLDLWQHNYEQHHFMAFSKAKHCLLVVGEIKGLINSYWWSKLVRDAEERGIIQQIEPTEKSVPIRVLMK